MSSAERTVRPGPATAIGRLGTTLSAALFRDEREQAAGWSPTLIAVWVVATGVALLREGKGISRVYAEDGAIFYPAQRQHGYVSVLLKGYEGYLHLVPRTIVAVSAQLPLPDLAYGLAIGSALVTGLMVTLVARILPAYGLRRPVAVATAMLLVLTPIGLSESIDAACNIQWFLACGCFWALLWAPSRKRWLAASCVTAFLTAGSAPLALVFVPLVLLRLWLLRGRQWAVAAAYAAGAGLQLYTMAHSTRDGITHPDTLTDLLRTLVGRLFTTTWFGVGNSLSLYDSIGFVVTAVAGVVWLAVLVVCLRDARAGWLLLAALAAGVLLFLAGTYNNFFSVGGKTGQPLYLVEDGRYSTSPDALMAMAAVCALVIARRSTRLATPVLAVVVLLLAGSAVRDFDYSTPRQSAPSWTQALSSAEQTCATNPAAATVLKLAPQPIDLTVSCAELASWE